MCVNANSEGFMKVKENGDKRQNWFGLSLEHVSFDEVFSMLFRHLVGHWWPCHEQDCCFYWHLAMQLCPFLRSDKLATIIRASASPVLQSYAAVYFRPHLDPFKVKSWQRIWPFFMLCQKGFFSCWLTWCWVVPAGCLLFQVVRKVFVLTCICI